MYCCYNRGSGLNQRLSCPKRLVCTLANWQPTTAPGTLFGKVKALVNCSSQRTVLSSVIVVLVASNLVFCQWVGLLLDYINNSVKSGSKQALVLQPISHTMTTKPRLSTCLTLTRIAARPSFHSWMQSNCIRELALAICKETFQFFVVEKSLA